MTFGIGRRDDIEYGQNCQIKENYRLTVVVCLFNRMSRIGRAQNQNSTNLLDAPYFWHRLIHSELSMYDFSSSSTNFYSVFSFFQGGLLFGMELVNYSKSRQQSRCVCVCLFPARVGHVTQTLFSCTIVRKKKKERKVCRWWAAHSTGVHCLGCFLLSSAPKVR